MMTAITDSGLLFFLWRASWQGALGFLFVWGGAILLPLLAARRTRHILRSASPIPSEQQTAALERLAQALGLRSVPALARSAAVGSPVPIAGTILIPAEAEYDEPEMSMILAHELAHVRRRDLLWEWLGTGVQVLFFFHPGVVLARRDPATRRPGRPIALVLVPLTALVFVPLQMTWGQAPASVSAPTTTAFPTLDLSPTSTPASATVPTVGTKTVTGVVLNDKNEPVAGLSVSLDWRWTQELKNGDQQVFEHTVPSVVTDVQGKFTFSKLREGDYTYDVRSQANEYVNAPGTFVLSKTDSQKDLRLVVSKGSLVSGRVVDGQTGKPFSGIFVVAGSIPSGGDLAHWDYWQISNTVLTDAQGHYQVRVLPGDAFVGVGRSDNGTVLSKRIREAVQKVSATLGQTAAAPDLSVLLHPTIAFVGPDGKPIANAQVRIIPDDLGHGGYILNDTTDADGTLVLNRFDSGSFHIQQGGLLASGTFRGSSSEPLMVRLNGRTEGHPSGMATVHLAEGSAGIVTGKVVSQDGAPISHARVHIQETTLLTRAGGDYVVGDTVLSTDKSGTFHASLDPTGEYHVFIRADGFNQVSVSGKQALNVARGATTNLGSIRLTRAAGFVAGRVVDSAGKPMEGVLVYVRGGQTFLSGTVTDAQGHFHVPNVIVGDVMHLMLCLKGQSPDSGEALSQSNDEMDFPDVTASTTEREIVWHPHS